MYFTYIAGFFLLSVPVRRSPTCLIINWIPFLLFYNVHKRCSFLCMPHRAAIFILVVVEFPKRYVSVFHRLRPFSVQLKIVLPFVNFYCTRVTFRVILFRPCRSKSWFESLFRYRYLISNSCASTLGHNLFLYLSPKNSVILVWF